MYRFRRLAAVRCTASIGQVYRQTPKAGTLVPKGTTIEIRSWWESG